KPIRTTRRFKQMRTRLLLLTGVVAALLATPAIANAATITVNTTDDVNPAQCTLRSAITAANTNAIVGGCVKGLGSDVINFNLPAASTITLGSALPAITSTVDVQGPGAGQLTVSGGDAVSVLNLSAAGSGAISGPTITHG